MRANRGRDTAPELAIRRGLHALGYRFYVDHRPIKSFNRRADIVFPRLRVAIFVDGCFWHGCPMHHTRSTGNADFWEAKVARNIARDANTDAELKAAGWRVERVWEHEDVASALARLDACLRQRRAEAQGPNPVP